MWEIIAGTAAGVLGVLIMWVGSGYLDLNLDLHPYERRLHGERVAAVAEGEGDVAATLADEDKDSRIGTGEMKVSYAVKDNVSETTVEKVDRDKDITLVQHDVGSRSRSRSRSRQISGDGAGAGTAGGGAGGGGGGFFGKKREFINMSVIP